jgi:glucosamine-6-phosphate deaminase
VANGEIVAGTWSKTDIADVPTRAITVTIPALLMSRCVYCMVPGLNKADAVKKALYGGISQDLPASILRVHPRSYLFLDRESAAEWGE